MALKSDRSGSLSASEDLRPPGGRAVSRRNIARHQRALYAFIPDAPLSSYRVGRAEAGRGHGLGALASPPAGSANLLSRAHVARTIARDWNAKDEFSGHVGFVTRFERDPEFATRYPVQVAGGKRDEELWVPAEELEESNDHIVGTIAVLETYSGPKFVGDLDPTTGIPRELMGPPKSSV